MSLSTAQYEKVIHFLDADMTLEEMNDFEKELKSNPEMQAQLEFEQSVRDSFSLLKKENSTAKVVHLNNETVSQLKVVEIKNNRKWIVGIAVALLIAIVSSVLFFNNSLKQRPALVIKNNDTISTNEIVKQPKEQLNSTPKEKLKDTAKGKIDFALLFKKYFVPDGVPETYPMALADALTEYKSGNYKAIQQFNEAMVSDTRGNDEINNKENIIALAHYYKGISFLETNNTKGAIENLEWVAKFGADKRIVEKAEWYLGLGYLKEGELEKADTVFQKILSFGKESYIKNKCLKIKISIKK